MARAKEYLSLKQYGAPTGVSAVDCSAIVSYSANNLSNTETKILLLGGHVVISYEPSGAFERRLIAATDPYINN